MYHRLKKIVLSAIPKKRLFQLEPLFRSFYYQFHRGNKHKCSICNKKLNHFVQINKDEICPNCGSISRNRRFWKFFQEELYLDNLQVLDFSPSRCIYRAFKKTNLTKYDSSDLSGDFISEQQYDITAINTPDQSYNLIICYHILEHVIDDVKAMKELYRILEQGGKCIIQTPFKNGDTYEDYNITTDKEREIHFGQNDHVRIYSASGLKERLEKVGFSVEAKVFNEDSHLGFQANETLLVCTKNK